MRRIVGVFAALTAASALFVGCPKKTQPEKPTPPKTQPTTQVAPPTPKTVAKKVGESCASEQPFGQGDCDAGLLCGPGPGGFCSALKDKGDSCPAPNLWIDTARAGEICAPPCKSDNDCRAAEGYTCDPGWSACALSGFAAPKAPVCSAAALTKKTFGAATQLATTKGPGLYAFEPTAALLPSGGLAVTYIAKNKFGESNPLGQAVISPAGVVEGDLTFTSDRQDHYDPWMAVDRGGKLYLVWLGFNGHRYPEKEVQIGLATSTDGKTWSKPIAAHDPADCPEGEGCFDKPMVAVGPQKKSPKADAVYVAYASEVAGGLRLVRSVDSGVTFGKAVTVTDGSYGDLEVDDKGDVHLVTVGEIPQQVGRAISPSARFGDEGNGVIYSRSTDEGATFTSSTVSEPGQKIPFYFSNPQVVSDTKKKLVYVVYPAGTPDGQWDIFLATSKDQGKTWSRIKVNDDASCGNHMTPTMTLDPKTNKLHIIWTENRSGQGGVAYTSCESGGKKCAPNEAVNDASFASYSLGRQSTKWQGEYYSLLVDNKNRKLHAVWTQTVDEGGEPHARIFHAEAKL